MWSKNYHTSRLSQERPSDSPEIRNHIDEIFGDRINGLGVLDVPKTIRDEAGGLAVDDLSTKRDRCYQTIIRRLTPREIDVLRLIADGHSTKQIAHILNISFKTVVCHRSQVLKKLGIHETATLVRLAVRAGLVPI